MRHLSLRNEIVECQESSQRQDQVPLSREDKDKGQQRRDEGCEVAIVREQEETGNEPQDKLSREGLDKRDDLVVPVKMCDEPEQVERAHEVTRSIRSRMLAMEFKSPGSTPWPVKSMPYSSSR